VNDVLEAHPAARMIRNRILQGAGIAIDPFISYVILSYFGQNCPDGFQFQPANADRLIELFRRSPRFGVATGVDMRPHAVVFREVHQPDSLHLRLDRFGGKSEMHLDKVSIAEGRDSAGQVIYVEDLARGIQHVCTDLIHRR
jgi:hypothetical protein